MSFNLHRVDTILWFVGCLFLFTFILSWILKYVLIKVILNRPHQSNTSLNFLKNSIQFLLFVMAFIVLVFSVPILRNQAKFIFSGAGILAAILGFAAKDAISNLVAGSFIVIFKPFRVGDYVRLDTSRVGIVQDITLRHTIINNFESKRLIIPNSIISTESILNHSIEDSFILSFNNFRVGILANLDLARKIIQEEALKLPYVSLTNQPETHVTNSDEIEVRVVDINESFILLRAYVWLNDPLVEFKMKCVLKEAIHKRFVEEGVDLPIPRRIVIKD